jgi:hypothetical protein
VWHRTYEIATKLTAGNVISTGPALDAKPPYGSVRMSFIPENVLAGSLEISAASAVDVLSSQPSSALRDCDSAPVSIASARSTSLVSAPRPAAHSARAFAATSNTCLYASSLPNSFWTSAACSLSRAGRPSSRSRIDIRSSPPCAVSARSWSLNFAASNFSMSPWHSAQVTLGIVVTDCEPRSRHSRM